MIKRDGIVIGISSRNTIKVKWDMIIFNKKIKKFIKVWRKVLVNTKNSFYDNGMKVRIESNRRITNMKSWEIVKVIDDIRRI